MADPMIGANSRLDDDTVSSNVAADTDFPLSNLSDDKLSPVYKAVGVFTEIHIITDAGVGNTVKVDYLYIGGHDLSNPDSDGLGNVTVTFEYSDDASTWVTIIADFAVTTNTIILRTFTEFDRRAFRIKMTRSGFVFLPSIGEAQWGKRVDLDGLEIGFDPQSETVNMQITKSQSGAIIGAVRTHSDRTADLVMPLVTNTFLRDLTLGGFQDVWDNHISLGKPFVFNWNPGDPGSFEKDAFFAVLRSSGIDRPIVTALDTGERNLEFSIIGQKE